MAGREVAGFGTQPGTAGGLPLPSVPSAKYTFELGPEKATFFPDKVKAEGKLRLNVFAATTYCTVFWAPFGRIARAVISYACFAVGGGFNANPLEQRPIVRCAPGINGGNGGDGLHIAGDGRRAKLVRILGVRVFHQQGRSRRFARSRIHDVTDLAQ